ncbi:hypothetical protein BY458DRAFT_495571 [Sporodiniella umbellata]|nr:hypothetical protein BY458DRAFT_495571 [Sporodiniella umbellata]
MIEQTDKPFKVWIEENANVILKLMTFTAALLVGPILTFFLTLHSLFEGNTTYAAIAAAAMANVIVALYIVVAFFEKPVDKKKKDQ